jgi:hypothetical protein
VADYATIHASALGAVQSNGAAVTFTRAVDSAYAPSTDTTTAGTSTTITGSAVDLGVGPGDSEEPGTSIASSATKLFFIPDTYGDLPAYGDTASWGGFTLRVTRVKPLQPAGTVLAAEVWCSL